MDCLVKINEFEGPLDLLLHFVKISNIQICDININEITDQYFSYIHKMEELNINVASEYLVMAATLMEIKSKSLLPLKKEEASAEEEEEVVSREDLIEKLELYQKYKEVTKEFKQLELKRREIYIKAPSKLSSFSEEIPAQKETSSVDVLVLAWEKYLARKDMEKPITTRITKKEYSVQQRKKDIVTFLKKSDHKKVEFSELLMKTQRSFVVVTFLSILELVKEEQIQVIQDHSFSEIYIGLKVV